MRHLNRRTQPPTRQQLVCATAYAAMLAAASSIADPTRRIKELAGCETALMRTMPFVALHFDTRVYLDRPDVRGLKLSLLGVPAFKYAWIDSSRRFQ